MRIDNNVKKISISFVTINAILLIISIFNPLKLYNVSFYTYYLIVLSIISFIVPFCIISKYLKNTKPIIDLNKLVKSKIFLIYVIVTLILVAFYKIKFEYIIQDLPQLEVRLARFNKLFDSSIEAIFFNYIISGTIYVLSIIFSILLVNKKIKNSLFILIAITILIYSFIGYGRMIYFNIIIYIFILFLLKKDLKKYINKKNILKLSLICFFIFCVFTFLIYIRIGNKKLSTIESIKSAINNQIQQVIEYSVGSYRLLDIFIQNGFEDFEENTYGIATFAGLEEIILYPIKAIGVDILSFNNKITKYTQKVVKIGENTNFNAYYTSIMNYYLDFNVLGVIIFPILHSILIIYCLKNYYNQKNVISLILLCYVIMNLFVSSLRWNYQSGTSTFVLIFLIILNMVKGVKSANIVDCK